MEVRKVRRVRKIRINQAINQTKHICNTFANESETHKGWKPLKLECCAGPLYAVWYIATVSTS